mmetsp:Transcript_3973/g.7184  ORF Transcript_3973/g.7184 Transcript_3973/m.7184 type:complete len:382 (+) Transcript_3973:75-1220(+)
MAALCPICFDECERPVEYATMHNHSWTNNSRCDAHGICWKCLNRHVEIQILDEGRFNLKCPGIGCNYRLIPLDVERALELSSTEQQHLALERYRTMRSASHAERLREVVSTSGRSESWLLEECQVCPQCLSLVRRETGCNHVFCRCGCDFCVGCGSPDTCLCEELVKDRDVIFAAWLRVSPDSPIEWLRAPSTPDVPQRLLTTLAFWLWMANIPVEVPWSEEEVPTGEELASLPALRWRTEEWLYIDEEDAFLEATMPQIFHFPVSRHSDVAELDGDEAEDFFQDYNRVPRRPWRLFATQRVSRRQDRHRYTPLRWRDLRPWSDGDCDAVVPLRRRRQPRHLAVAARSAESSAAVARSVQEQRKRRQRARRVFRDECTWLE